MKRFRSICIVLSLSAGLAFAQQIKISFPMGDIQVQSADASQKKKASFNQVVKAGETVISGKGSRAEISRGDKLVVRLDQETQVKIASSSNELLTVNHKKGELWVNNLSGEMNISIAGAAGFVNAGKATFRVSSSAAGTLTIWVYNGVVTVKPPGAATIKWQEKVPAGQHMTVGRDGAFNKKDFNENDDESSWLKWNRQRDKMANK